MEKQQLDSPHNSFVLRESDVAQRCIREKDTIVQNKLKSSPETGATLVEYALLVAIIAVGAIVAMQLYLAAFLPRAEICNSRYPIGLFRRRDVAAMLSLRSWRVPAVGCYALLPLLHLILQSGVPTIATHQMLTKCVGATRKYGSVS